MENEEIADRIIITFSKSIKGLKIKDFENVSEKLLSDISKKEKIFEIYKFIIDIKSANIFNYLDKYRIFISYCIDEDVILFESKLSMSKLLEGLNGENKKNVYNRFVMISKVNDQLTDKFFDDYVTVNLKNNMKSKILNEYEKAIDEEEPRGLASNEEPRGLASNEEPRGLASKEDLRREPAQRLKEMEDKKKLVNIFIEHVEKNLSGHDMMNILYGSKDPLDIAENFVNSLNDPTITKELINTKYLTDIFEAFSKSKFSENKELSKKLNTLPKILNINGSNISGNNLSKLNKIKGGSIKKLQKEINLNDGIIPKQMLETAKKNKNKILNSLSMFFIDCCFGQIFDKWISDKKNELIKYLIKYYKSFIIYEFEKNNVNLNDDKLYISIGEEQNVLIKEAEKELSKMAIEYVEFSKKNFPSMFDKEQNINDLLIHKFFSSSEIIRNEITRNLINKLFKPNVKKNKFKKKSKN